MQKKRLLFLLILSCVFTTNNVCADASDVDIYFGFGTQAQIFVEGRIIEKRNSSSASESDSWFKNVVRKLQRLINDERKFEQATLYLGDGAYQVTTDEEGYFSLTTTTPAGLTPGWNSLNVELKDNTQVRAEFLLVPSENRFGIISDFDDTLIESDVLDKAKLVAKNLFENYKQRQVVKGMPALFQRLAQRNAMPAAAPIFIISASPRQIQRDVKEFLAYHQFPASLVITKTVTGDNHDSLTDQKQYKINKIKQVLERLPKVKFLLIGDDGEQDPESFHELRQQYPAQIIAVWIHKVHSNPNRQRYPGQILFDDAQQLTLP